MKSILTNTRKPDIAFHKSGLIEITARVAKILKVSQGDVIDILSDDEEMYLFVKHRNPIGRNAAAVYQSNKRGAHYRAWSVKLSDAILKECKVDNDVRLAVGEPLYNFEDIDIVLPIITRRIL